MYQHILFATDGSDTANLALKEAISLAKDGARITAIAVVDNPLANYGSPYGAMPFNFDAVHEEFLTRAQTILQETAQAATRAEHIQINTQLIDLGINSSHDDIAGAIEKAAHDCQADLIVIGTHGRHGFKRFFLGSVAEDVIRQSPIPVLIVRGPTADQTTDTQQLS